MIIVIKNDPYFQHLPTETFTDHEAAETRLRETFRRFGYRGLSYEDVNLEQADGMCWTFRGDHVLLHVLAEQPLEGWPRWAHATKE